MYSKFLIALSTILLLFLVHLRGELAWAHAYPAVSIPNNGATVKEPPREVRIQFTEGVEIAFSQITG
jgi:methionine-rich copper-binding protein CopC